MNNTQANNLVRLMMVRERCIEKPEFFRNIKNIKQAGIEARRNMYQYALKFADKFEINKSDDVYKTLQERLDSVDDYQVIISLKNPTIESAFYYVKNKTYLEIKELVKNNSVI